MEQTTFLMPREKLLQFGAEALSDQELLAIFLRTGIKNCPVMQLSASVLAQFGSLRNLISAEKGEFCAVKGLGVTQFVQLQAGTEMTKRYLLQELAQVPLLPNRIRCEPTCRRNWNVKNAKCLWCYFWIISID